LKPIWRLAQSPLHSSACGHTHAPHSFSTQPFWRFERGLAASKASASRLSGGLPRAPCTHQHAITTTMHRILSPRSRSCVSKGRSQRARLDACLAASPSRALRTPCNNPPMWPSACTGAPLSECTGAKQFVTSRGCRNPDACRNCKHTGLTALRQLCSSNPAACRNCMQTGRTAGV
jgi:hypothetical protein